MADGSGPLQGLHLDAQAQRLPVAAHHGDPRFEDADRNPDPQPRDARAGRARACRPLGLQGRPAAGGHSRPLDRRPGRDPRPCRKPRGAARAYAHGDVPGPDLRLHSEGRADPAAQGRDAGRFRLCGPYRPRRPDRWRQGQRPRRAAPDHARERRPGRNPGVRGAAPAAVVAPLRRHRQGARRSPPLRPPQGARRDDRARAEDLRRDRRAAARRARQGRAQARVEEAQDRESRTS